MDSSRIRNRRNKTAKLRTMESNTINEKSNNIYLEVDKKIAKTIFREGYYAGNAKARTHKGSMIMEDILNEDFENKWNDLTSNKKV
jgi:hypothetical protein